MNSRTNTNRRLAVISSLQAGKFSDYKNSELLIDKLKRQRDTVYMNKCADMVKKQQEIVRSLDHENLLLTDENEQLRRDLAKADHEISALKKRNKDLIEQNENLKAQLATSQNFGIRVLNELKASKHKSRPTSNQSCHD